MSNTDMLTIKSITDLHRVMGYPKPVHPLISMVDLSKAELNTDAEQKVLCHLYGISLKTNCEVDEITYGHQHFDFKEGVLFGMAPGQVFQVSGKIEKGDMEGWALYFHPDLLHGYPLADSISTFGFFDYVTREALHLSEKEKGILNDISLRIQDECDQNMDDYSHDLLISHLELLLNYIRRYYGRQFKTRKTINSSVLSNFEILLREYFRSDTSGRQGLPTVGYFADSLHLSSSYFSDLIKKETGLTAQDHLHVEIVRQAKILLANSEVTVSEIAYQLGFEHPPYFARLFKKKTGKTPTQYRKQKE